MKTQKEQPSRPERRCHTLEKTLGLLFGGQNAKAVIRAKDRIERLGELESRHVSFKRLDLQLAPLQAVLQKLDRRRAQVKAGHVIAAASHLHHHPPTAAGGL